MPSISTLVFITIFPFVIGYAVAEARNLNFWKLLPVAFVLYFFFGEAKQTSMLISGVAFGVGYTLPHFSIFAGIRDAISFFIDSIRYRSVFEDIKRKEREAEDAKAHYERAREEADEERKRYEQARRKSEQESRSQGQQKQQSYSSSSGGRGRSGSSGQSNRQQKSSQSNQSGQSQKSSFTERKRDEYLAVMQLATGKWHSKTDLKKQYRRRSMKCHPDRGGSHNEFVKLTEAYEWLVTNS